MQRNFMRTFAFRAIGVRGLLPALVAGTLCGCAALGAPTQKGYGEAMQTWVGEPTSDLIARWGQPANRYPGPDNGTILQYVRTTGNTTDLHTTQQPDSNLQGSSAPNAGAEAFRTLGARSGMSVQVTRSCTTRFTADSGGIVRQFQFAGNGCFAAEPENGHWGASAQPLLPSRIAAPNPTG
jgi:hypothetical protein